MTTARQKLRPNMATLVMAPGGEPLTLAEVKLHLRIDANDEDSLIDSLITAARVAVEERCRIALLPQTWRESFDRFPLGAGYFQLGRPPFIQVNSIKYIDMAGVEQTLTAGAYEIVTTGMLAQVHHAFGVNWPIARQKPSSVTVEWQAGYADSTKVPADIKAWMKIMIGTLYENREAVIKGQTSASSFSARGFADGLLDPYRVPEVA